MHFIHFHSKYFRPGELRVAEMLEISSVNRTTKSRWFCVKVWDCCGLNVSPDEKKSQGLSIIYIISDYAVRVLSLAHALIAEKSLLGITCLGIRAKRNYYTVISPGKFKAQFSGMAKKLFFPFLAREMSITTAIMTINYPISLRRKDSHSGIPVSVETEEEKARIFAVLPRRKLFRNGDSRNSSPENRTWEPPPLPGALFAGKVPLRKWEGFRRPFRRWLWGMQVYVCVKRIAPPTPPRFSFPSRRGLIVCAFFCHENHLRPVYKGGAKSNRGSFLYRSAVGKQSVGRKI